MTLIAEVHKTGDGFVAMADSLISLSVPKEGSQNFLPFQYGLGNGFGTHAIGCASKAVIFGNYIVLWAGRVSSAKALIQKFMALDNPQIDDLGEQ